MFFEMKCVGKVTRKYYVGNKCVPQWPWLTVWWLRDRHPLIPFNLELMTTFTDTLTNRSWRDIFHRSRHTANYAGGWMPMVMAHKWWRVVFASSARFYGLFFSSRRKGASVSVEVTAAISSRAVLIFNSSRNAWLFIVQPRLKEKSLKR